MNGRSGSDRLIEGYLTTLERALAGLPALRRQEVVEEIARHIADARARLAVEDEAGVRAILDRVGDPEAIALEAGAPRAGTVIRSSDAWVPWLLLGGGFAFGVGWFVGIGLLWSSTTWRVRDKLLGTLVWPGGLFGLFMLLGTGVGTGCSAGVAVQAPAPAPVAVGSLPVGPLASSGPPAAGLPSATHCASTAVSLPLPVGMAAAGLAVVAAVLVAVHLERVRRRRTVASFSTRQADALA